jgi:hypothetical protein
VSLRAPAVRAIGVALVWVSCAADAYAYRPFDSTDAAVAEGGRCEIELGPVGYVSEIDGRFLVAPAVIFNFGLTDRWELVIEGKNAWPLDGKSDRSLHLRDNAASVKGILRQGVLQNRSGASIAVEISTLLPDAGAEDGVGQAVTGIVSQRWAAATLHVNGAVALTRAHSFGAAGGLIVEGPDRWVVRPVAELLMEHEDETAVSGLVGAIWDVRDHLSLDVGWRQNVNGSAGHELRAGMTLSFGFRSANVS